MNSDKFLIIINNIIFLRSGSVCLDVINQAWSPMYDLTNVFDIFLPQLLTYPNPKDPLNADAAALLIIAPDIFRIKTKQYVIKYANGDPNILNNEKFLIKKDEIQHNSHLDNNNQIRKNSFEKEEEKFSSDEKFSDLSQVSELSKTSSIDLIEEGY